MPIENTDRRYTWNKENLYKEIIYKQKRKLKKKGMMYATTKGSKYTTRGGHTEDVALIAMGIAQKLGGNPHKAYMMGLVHDFGHTPLAHTGETGLGMFLISLEEPFNSDVREEEIKKSFDHASHGPTAMMNIAGKYGAEVPQYIINSMESHSTGNGVDVQMKCDSFEAECVMRADKIASAVSDVRDMIAAGVLKTDDKSLSDEVIKSDVIRDLVTTRVFGKYETDEKKQDLITEYMIAAGGELGKRIQEVQGKKDSEEFNEKRLKLIREFVNLRTKKYLRDIKDFLTLPPEKQSKRLINLIVDGISNNPNKKIDTKEMDNYREEYPKGQLSLPIGAEALLAGVRGLLKAKEANRTLGKMGSELESLVENVCRYVYLHKEDFENQKPFDRWDKKSNGEKFLWKEKVAFGIGKLTDEEFKNFAKKLLEREDAREALKRCKYRDERDRAQIKKYNLKNVPFSVYDFSTPEAIDDAFEVRAGRSYKEPILSKGDVGSAGDGEERKRRRRESIEIDR